MKFTKVLKDHYLEKIEKVMRENREVQVTTKGTSIYSDNLVDEIYNVMGGEYIILAVITSETLNVLNNKLAERLKDVLYEINSSPEEYSRVILEGTDEERYVLMKTLQDMLIEDSSLYEETERIALNYTNTLMEEILILGQGIEDMTVSPKLMN